MQIVQNVYVIFEYHLFLDTGDALTVSESDRPIGFIVGQGHMWPAIERQLMGMETGQSATVFLEPMEAFGMYDPMLVREVPRTQFPDDVELKPTMPFQANCPTGPMTFVIKSVGDELVTVDLNHPLAGRRIKCEVVVHEVRQLTENEKALLSGKKLEGYNPLGSISGLGTN
jgi:FKBP-type peptidyl-prolyl cis-trans isomerase SlyD